MIVGVDPDPANAGEITALDASTTGRRCTPTPPGGAYVNFMMETRARSGSGPPTASNYERLAQVKAEYDPDNLFRVNQNIRPDPALVAPYRSRMTCASCGAENREGARFCDACGAALAAAPQAREQRKTVTVLFCDVAGSTALGERLDPEALRAVMARYFDVARVAIERHGGTLEKFIGDAVMAVFGVRVVREDDALRAVRAAEELRDAVDVDVRIGVNTGAVVTGTADSLVTGDAVNVAARLEQAAEPGEVLLGSETYRLVRDAVDAELLPPLAAKGKSEPLTAYRLRAVTGDVAVARRQDAPLVGRTRERRLLEDAWERTRSERACSLFTILGTRRCRQVAPHGRVPRAGSMRPSSAGAACLRRGDHYWPVVGVVKQLLGDDAARRPGIAALLGDGQADRRRRSRRRCASSSRRLRRDRPLVVVFDDIHWGEPTFLDLVEHVADWSRDAPILLLCLARPELLELRPGLGRRQAERDDGAARAAVGAETDELIDALLDGRALDAGAPRADPRRRGGQPALRRADARDGRGVAGRGDGAADDPGAPRGAARPAAGRRAGRARARRGRGPGLPRRRGRGARARRPRRAARVCSASFARSSSGRARRTFPGDDAFRFRHLLIRDAAYEALPKASAPSCTSASRRWLEGRAPDLVELDEILGYHLEQAARYRAELGDPSAELCRSGPRSGSRRRAGAPGARRGCERVRVAAPAGVRACSSRTIRGGSRSCLRSAQALYVLGRLDEAYADLRRGDRARRSRHRGAGVLHEDGVRGHGESISPYEIERDVRERLARVEGAASDGDARRRVLTARLGAVLGRAARSGVERPSGR